MIRYSGPYNWSMAQAAPQPMLAAPIVRRPALRRSMGQTNGNGIGPTGYVIVGIFIGAGLMYAARQIIGDNG